MDSDVMQTVAAGALVLAAVLYLGRRWVAVAASAVRRRKGGGGGGGCDAGCGCGH